MKNFWKKVATWLGFVEELEEPKTPFFSPPTVQHTASPHVIHYPHNPSWIAAEMQQVAEEPKKRGKRSKYATKEEAIAGRKQYLRDYQQQHKDHLYAKQKERRAQKAAAKAELTAEELEAKKEAKREYYRQQYILNRDKRLEAVRAKRGKTAETVRGYTHLNLGVSPSKDGRSAYNKAYNDYNKQVGNNSKTFSLITN